MLVGCRSEERPNRVNRLPSSPLCIAISLSECAAFGIGGVAVFAKCLRNVRGLGLTIFLLEPDKFSEEEQTEADAE